MHKSLTKLQSNFHTTSRRGGPLDRLFLFLTDIPLEKKEPLPVGNDSLKKKRMNDDLFDDQMLRHCII